MRKIKWLAMVSIFVVGVLVFGIIINLKHQEQNDTAEGNKSVFATLQVDIENKVKDSLYRFDGFSEVKLKKIPEGVNDTAEGNKSVFATLQVDIENKVKDSLYQFDGLSEIELKKIPEGIKKIDTAPFEEIAGKYEKKELYSEDFQVEYEGLTITKDTTEEEIIDYLGFPENFENSNGGFISGGNGYRRWSLCYPNQLEWREEQEESHEYLRIVILSQGGGYYSDETWVEPISSYLVFIELAETSRGIKRGDSIESIFEAYGSPDIIQDYEPSRALDDNHAEIIYMGDDISLHFVISENTMTIEYIFVDINMEKSRIDQGL